MNQQRLFVIQTILEAAIPVAGYFAWNWDLSFILLFYLLDAVLALGILVAKGNKRLQFSKLSTEKRLFVRHVVASVLLFASAITIIALAVIQVHPGLEWTERIWAFLTYRDMGIEQGYVLVPLILLNGILVYRQQFIMPARYRKTEMRAITGGYVKQGLVLLAAAGLFEGIAFLVQLPEVIAVSGFITGISFYRFFLIRRA